MHSRLCRSVCVIVTVLPLLAVAGPAGATQLAFWDFENVTSAGTISTSQASSSIPSLSAVITQDGGGPAELFAPPYGMVFLTRQFGLFHPWAELTVTEPIILRRVRFEHLHNNNPGHPTYPDYYVQLQIDMGSGYVDVGDRVLLNQSTFGAEATVDVGNLVLDPGTYYLRWDPRGLHGSTDTGSEYFALNDVALEGAASVGVPAMGTRGAALLASLLAAAAVIVLIKRRSV